MKTLLVPLLLCALLLATQGAEIKPTALEVTAGKKFAITLKSNPSTGYSWALEKLPADAVVKFVEKKYERPNTNLIGAGGVEVWTFEPRQPGKAKIVFNYARPWEKDKAPAETKIFQITVK